MILISRSFTAAVLGTMLMCGGTSHAQDSGPFDRMFGREPARERQAQAIAPDLTVRMDRLENQNRQLTGMIEQLQFRNQQLEQQVKRFQEDVEFRFQEQGGRGGARPSGPAAAQGRPPAQPPAAASQPVHPSTAPPSSPGRRSDAFDPTHDPNAPGAPRSLGSLHSAAPPAVAGAEQPIIAEPPVGAPSGRVATTAPLDLSTLSGAAANDPSLVPSTAQPGNGLPPPPPRNPNATGALASVSPPTQTPRDEYDLAYGYVLRKDYALAEQQFRSFLSKYPSDRMSPDALYWLGESLFQRQRYRDAAESFLTVSTKHETAGKAPDALLRLGQSLAALGEKETACATLGEISRKYPRASLNVKQGVEREQKRARC